VASFLAKRRSITGIQAQKIEIAQHAVIRLKRRLRGDFEAAGVTGSVARGTAEVYSDVDLLIVVKRVRQNLGNVLILNNTYCSVSQKTFKSAVAELSFQTDRLPEIIGGYSRILPIYDPRSLLPKLEEQAVSIPSEVFQPSAQLALLHSYEDFCRVKNAYINHDDFLLIDNVQFVTYSAALIVASLNHQGYISDREVFTAHNRFRKLPERFDRILSLRYEKLNRRALYATLLEFYVDLVRFCRMQGLSFPVRESSLHQLRRS
jgi:predicted nucleotidyltransferase